MGSSWASCGGATRRRGSAGPPALPRKPSANGASSSRTLTMRLAASCLLLRLILASGSSRRQRPSKGEKCRPIPGSRPGSRPTETNSPRADSCRLITETEGEWEIGDLGERCGVRNSVRPGPQVQLMAARWRRTLAAGDFHRVLASSLLWLPGCRYAFEELVNPVVTHVFRVGKFSFARDVEHLVLG